ncbi:MAG: hypothetical protein LUQ49_02590 [Methanomicrobiales archaeon]|nr:hypothetical protein [Methanomicrobiales archaeon]
MVVPECREEIEQVISRDVQGKMINMPYIPVAEIVILGLPLAIWIGAATLLALLATATLGMLITKEGYNIPFSWHVNLARITILVAILHGLVVYWTFF